MNRMVNTPRRRYHSPVRDQRALETRERILDATVRVMAGGPAEVSIPAVAREAGVSVPTVYAHFGTKRDLLAAIYPHVVRRAGLDELRPPRSIDEFRDAVRAAFRSIESLDEVARAAMASPAAEEARQISMPERVALAKQLLETAEPGLTGEARDRIARLLVIVTTSSALHVWRDYLGASVDEAADDVEWLLRAAIAAARREQR